MSYRHATFDDMSPDRSQRHHIRRSGSSNLLLQQRGTTLQKSKSTVADSSHYTFAPQIVSSQSTQSLAPKGDRLDSDREQLPHGGSPQRPAGSPESIPVTSSPLLDVLLQAPPPSPVLADSPIQNTQSMKQHGHSGNLHHSSRSPISTRANPATSSFSASPFALPARTRSESMARNMLQAGRQPGPSALTRPVFTSRSEVAPSMLTRFPSWQGHPPSNASGHFIAQGIDNAPRFHRQTQHSRNQGRQGQEQLQPYSLGSSDPTSSVPRHSHALHHRQVRSKGIPHSVPTQRRPIGTGENRTNVGLNVPMSPQQTSPFSFGIPQTNPRISVSVEQNLDVQQPRIGSSGGHAYSLSDPLHYQPNLNVRNIQCAPANLSVEPKVTGNLVPRPSITSIPTSSIQKRSSHLPFTFSQTLPPPVHASAFQRLPMELPNSRLPSAGHVQSLSDSQLRYRSQVGNPPVTNTTVRPSHLQRRPGYVPHLPYTTNPAAETVVHLHELQNRSEPVISIPGHAFGVDGITGQTLSHCHSEANVHSRNIPRTTGSAQEISSEMDNQKGVIGIQNEIIREQQRLIDLLSDAAKQQHGRIEHLETCLYNASQQIRRLKDRAGQRQRMQSREPVYPGEGWLAARNDKLQKLRESLRLKYDQLERQSQGRATTSTCHTSTTASDRVIRFMPDRRASGWHKDSR